MIKISVSRLSRIGYSCCGKAVPLFTLPSALTNIHTEMIMKNKLLLPLLAFAVAGCANNSSAPVSKSTTPDFSEIGAYIGKLRMSERGVREILGYCESKFPEHHADIKRAQEAWELKNSYLIKSEKEITIAWFFHAGLKEADIPILMVGFEQAFDQYKDVNPAAKAIDALESQADAKRMQTCGLYTGLVIGGGQDIRVIAPQVQALYEKYSSSQ